MIHVLRIPSDFLEGFLLTLFRLSSKRPSSLKSVTHPTMMRLATVIPYIKKIQKMYKSCDRPFEFG